MQCHSVPTVPSTLTWMNSMVPLYGALMKNGLPGLMQSPASECYIMIQVKTTAGRQAGSYKSKQSWNKPFSLRGNLRLSESSQGWRSYLPSLCSLGQRVKKLLFLREPLTSFVKENIAIFCGLLPFTDRSQWKQLLYVLSGLRVSDGGLVQALAFSE